MKVKVTMTWLLSNLIKHFFVYMLFFLGIYFLDFFKESLLTTFFVIVILSYVVLVFYQYKLYLIQVDEGNLELINFFWHGYKKIPLADIESISYESNQLVVVKKDKQIEKVITTGISLEKIESLISHSRKLIECRA